MPLLSSLPITSLQLILHCCDMRTWLSLARCSRFTVAAASSDFAAQRLSPLVVDFTQPWPLADSPHASKSLDERVALRDDIFGDKSLAVLLRTSLLRYCTVCVRMKFSHDPPSYGRPRPPEPKPLIPRNKQINTMRDMDRLVALHIGGDKIEGPTPVGKLYAYVATAPSLRNVRELHVRMSALDCPNFIGLLAANAPHLHTFHMFDITSRLRPTDLTDLPKLTQLTDLHLPVLAPPFAAPLAACSRLERLTIRHLLKNLATNVLLAPALRTLRYLSFPSEQAPLHRGQGEAATQPAIAGLTPRWRDVFTHLVNLEELATREVAPDEMLTGLALSRHAKMQVLRLEGFAYDANRPRSLPLTAVLREVLGALPHIRIQLCVMSTVHASDAPPGAATMTDLLCREYASLHVDPARLTIERRVYEAHELVLENLSIAEFDKPGVLFWKK